jgi:hypothetical protein
LAFLKGVGDAVVGGAASLLGSVPVEPFGFGVRGAVDVVFFMGGMEIFHGLMAVVDVKRV